MAEAIDHQRAVNWLEAADYSIRFREQGWVECLVMRDDERWIGRGTDEQTALADIVWQMLPSHAARVLAALDGVIVDPDDGDDESADIEPANPPIETLPASATHDPPSSAEPSEEPTGSELIAAPTIDPDPPPDLAPHPPTRPFRWKCATHLPPKPFAKWSRNSTSSTSGSRQPAKRSA